MWPVTMDTIQELILLTVVVVATLMCRVNGVTGEIRCYCNDASCVRSGYMCKSSLGQCFSQLTYERDSTRSVHGCSESLPLEDKEMCAGTRTMSVDAVENKPSEKTKWPILLCCKNDMCNYMDNLDINIYVTKNNGTKASMWIGSTGRSQSEDEQDDDVAQQAPPYGVAADGTLMMTSQRDLWFKAAVIAVPIAGGFILVVLVLLALRWLRPRDSYRRRHMLHGPLGLWNHSSSSDQRRSLTKAQLYVAAGHFYHNQLLTNSNNNTNGNTPTTYALGPDSGSDSDGLNPTQAQSDHHGAGHTPGGHTTSRLGCPKAVGRNIMTDADTSVIDHNKDNEPACAGHVMTSDNNHTGMCRHDVTSVTMETADTLLSGNHRDIADVHRATDTWPGSSYPPPPAPSSKFYRPRYQRIRPVSSGAGGARPVPPSDIEANSASSLIVWGGRGGGEGGHNHHHHSTRHVPPAATV